MSAIEVSADAHRLDVMLIHEFLSQQSYWARGRSREAVATSMRNSICFGAYDGDRQVGFARAVTDRAVFAYIADVFVLPQFRGRGIGKMLMHAVVEHPDLRGLAVMLLRTRDAHGLYARFGFEAAANPDELLVRRVEQGTGGAVADP
jgi:GNAT superfamily N-acetyltransferase